MEILTTPYGNVVGGNTSSMQSSVLRARYFFFQSRRRGFLLPTQVMGIGLSCNRAGVEGGSKTKENEGMRNETQCRDQVGRLWRLDDCAQVALGS